MRLHGFSLRFRTGNLGRGLALMERCARLPGLRCAVVFPISTRS